MDRNGLERTLAAAAAGVLVIAVLAMPRAVAMDAAWAAMGTPGAIGDVASGSVPLVAAPSVAPSPSGGAGATVDACPAGTVGVLPDGPCLAVSAAPAAASAAPAAAPGGSVAVDEQPASAPAPAAAAASPPAPVPAAAAPTTSAEPEPDPAAVPAATPAPAPVATADPDGPDAPARPSSWTVDVHAGLGTWIDVFDWSVSHGGPDPAVTPATIDGLAEHGVATIYLQTARISAPDAVLEPQRLQALIDRAHDHGIAVVGWYLPTFEDPDDDWRRIEAAMALDIDGFALDIESQEVADPAERTRRLLAMSQRLHALAGDRVLVANVLPPVQLEELAPSLWPDFPWAELGEQYDVFMPMGYFTFREDGHRWRDAEAYTAENVRRVRERVGDPALPVHFIGGIADRMTVEDVEGMTRAARDTGALGLSVYDVVTTGSELWAPMQAWRELR